MKINHIQNIMQRNFNRDTHSDFPYLVKSLVKSHITEPRATRAYGEI